MTPANKIIDTTKKDRKLQPFVDATTGLCIACGMEDAHKWSCITWFMAVATRHYREKLKSAQTMLRELNEYKHLSHEDIKRMVDDIQHTVDIAKELGDE